ncbi:MAG: hypothetical protein E6Q97_02620 [Desulfurellales bacterium]|nr:MAG: hypothetical protein E6Q97_02620 [Desulfurellales bacterium]
MARRTKGDGSLFQRKSGLWVGAVEIPTADGSRRQKQVTSMDRNKAIEKLRKLRRDVEEGYLPVTGATTVARWLDQWLTTIHGREVRPSTRVSYEATIRLYILPAIGDRRLDKLTPEHVRRMHTHAEKTSGRAAQKAHIILQRALDDAIKEGLLRTNVAARVHKPRHRADVREPLTTDQAKHLLRVAITNGDPLASRWAAALLLGARQGELLGLQWDRVDLDHGLIDLTRQLQQVRQAHGCGERHPDGTWPCGMGKPGHDYPSKCPRRRWETPADFELTPLHGSLALTKPKTKAGGRLVPIPEPLWLMLLDHQGKAGLNPHNLVWRHDDGRPISPRLDYTLWQAALAAAELPAAPLHVARHTTASLLAEAGVSEHVRMQILGHVAVAAHRGYVHVDVEQRRQAMASLDTLLELDAATGA